MKNKLEKQAARKKEMEERKRKQLAERGTGRGRKRKCLETPSASMGHHTLYSMSDSDSLEIEQYQSSDSEPNSPEQESEEEPGPSAESLESEEDDHRNQLGEPEPGPSAESCCPRRHGVLPAHFWDELSDDDDGVICDLCSLEEPLDMAGDIVFWVNCDLCGVWVHTYCAFNKNAVSRKCFLCLFLLFFNITYDRTVFYPARAARAG